MKYTTLHAFLQQITSLSKRFARCIDMNSVTHIINYEKALLLIELKVHNHRYSI